MGVCRNCLVLVALALVLGCGSSDPAVTFKKFFGKRMAALNDQPPKVVEVKFIDHAAKSTAKVTKWKKLTLRVEKPETAHYEVFAGDSPESPAKATVKCIVTLLAGPNFDSSQEAEASTDAETALDTREVSFNYTFQNGTWTLASGDVGADTVFASSEERFYTIPSLPEYLNAGFGNE